MNTNDFRQEHAMEDFFAGNAMSSNVASAKAVARLAEYRPDPTTGKQKLGVSLKFGLVTLDQHIQMLKGCYYLVAARARTGKSAFGMQIADAAMRQFAGTDRVVVIFSAEMDAASLALREACAVEKVKYWDLARGVAQQDEYDRVQLRLEDMGNKGFWLDESSAPSIEHMLAQLTAIAESNTIGLVLFDYLELSGEFDRDEPKRIAKISRGLKSIAKKFDCPVLALGQLNRNIESNAGRQPNLSDLMYGGEREPDGIIIMHRPWLYDDTEPRELVNVYIVKHRHGPGGHVILKFVESTMRFDTATIERTPLNKEE